MESEGGAEAEARGGAGRSGGGGAGRRLLFGFFMLGLMFLMFFVVGNPKGETPLNGYVVLPVNLLFAFLGLLAYSGYTPSNPLAPMFKFFSTGQELE